MSSGLFPAGAGMNRPAAYAQAKSKVALFPAGAGMNRTEAECPVGRKHLFPAGAGMNRWKNSVEPARTCLDCSPQARG